MAADIWAIPYAETAEPCQGQVIVQETSSNPAWGPGNFIAYERGDEFRSIYVVDAETGEECQVTSKLDSRNPTWAPVGFDPDG